MRRFSLGIRPWWVVRAGLQSALRRFGGWTVGIAGCAIVLLLWAGCSSEGGVVGSGISATVQGNVIEVNLEGGGGAEEDEPIPPVLVSIDEAPDLAPVETMPDGSFEISGEFSGDVTVRFSEPGNDEDRCSDTVPVQVPAGAISFLPDVEVRCDQNPAVHVNRPKLFNVSARLQEIDCEGMRLRAQDESPSPHLISLRLLESTELTTRGGDPATCSQLVPGTRILLVEGVVDTDGEQNQGVIDAVRIVTDPLEPRPTPGDVRAHRRGFVLRTNCSDGVIHFTDRDLSDLVKVQLGPQTRFECEGIAADQCNCAGIQFGDVIEVDGVRRIERAGVIQAERAVVRPNPQTQIVRTLRGDIQAIDCEQGRMEIVDRRLGNTVVSLVMDDSTAFQCGLIGRRSCECDDLGIGDRAHVDVLVPLDPPGDPRALTVLLVATARRQMSGQVVAASCRTSQVVVRSTQGERVLVELTPSTVIEFPGWEASSCEQIELGDVIMVDGRNKRRPELPLPILIADRVQVRPSTPIPARTATPVVRMLFTGHVVGVECSNGSLGTLRLMDARGRVVTVVSTPETELRKGNDPASCAEVVVGERALVEGVEGMGTPEIQATEIRVAGRAPVRTPAIAAGAVRAPGS